MLKQSAIKIGKKRGGVLHVFRKAIKELEKLNGEADSQIKVSEDKIKKEQEEKAALEQEKKFIDSTVGKLKSVIGFDVESVPTAKK